MDELDRILAGDDAPPVSSGFSARVMAAVEAGADAENEPFPFPWGRVAVGVVAGLVAAAAAAHLLGDAGMTTLLTPLGAPVSESGTALAALAVVFLAVHAWRFALVEVGVNARD